MGISEKNGNSNEDFYRSRHSLIVSPTENSDEGVRNFLEKRMGVPREVVEDLKIERFIQKTPSTQTEVG